MDTKIYLVTYSEYVHGRYMRLVSHGVGDVTFKNYVLPQEPVESFKPKRDDAGLYIDA